ncbi:hypothetical protein GCM10022199_13940 [Marihabitans asiaticum]|uniref:DUF559 domain-containing protein n=2 Tax=Marihabitans asiaticum TaxID=415218 RepID=A0A560W8E9_9MICO|nr:hypothetical protein FB557_2555 [Marihabitans asiaticum]
MHAWLCEQAADTDLAVSRVWLRGKGIDRKMTARQVRQRRWSVAGRQTIHLRDAPLTDLAQRWRAVWETGEGVALVDGVSALQAAGLTGWRDDVVHVSLLHRHDYLSAEGVKVHKVARRVDDEQTSSGLPRTRPAVAAIRAAHWAVTDRSAATILAMAVQQRIVTGAQLVEAQRVVRGRTRRALIKALVGDIADGAHSLGELDFTAQCRARGIPAPTRQVLRTLPNGHAYLDGYYEANGVVVEIDGAGHLWGLKTTEDYLRANELVLGEDRVLRINVVGLRVEADAFFDQLARGLALPPLRPQAATPFAD